MEIAGALQEITDLNNLSFYSQNLSWSDAHIIMSGHRPNTIPQKEGCQSDSLFMIDYESG